MSAGKIYIGTSGWMYKSWAKTFYPDDWPARRHLEFYCSKFPTVEINTTFYRLPQEKTFETWQEQACPGFLYAVKGSQVVTHFKRLRPGAKSFRLLLKRATLTTLIGNWSHGPSVFAAQPGGG